MSLIILESLSFILYCGLFIYALRKLTAGDTLSPKASMVLVASLISHGLVSYLHIDGGDGQNLSLFNIFSATTWIAMTLVCWNLFRHKAHSLLLVSLPIAAISIIEVSFFSGASLIHLNGKFINLFHIFAGIASMSILLLAALQSALILYLDKGLRNHPAHLHLWLGPLEGMERYLVQLLTTGFILMSISLFLVIFLPGDLKSSQVIHKVVLTVISWIVLASLMFGRYFKGWRGVFAAKWCILGVFLLLLGYFGSKLALEFFLN